MIKDIEVRNLKKNTDERGFLMEILRSDWDVYEQFAQTYVSMNYPGVVRAWHYHKKQDDFWVVVSGMVKAVVFDCREDSPTKGEINEFFMGDDNPILLKIPVGTMHGYKTIGTSNSLLMNFPTQLWNAEEPDEFREPWDSKNVPYSWDIKFK